VILPFLERALREALQDPGLRIEGRSGLSGGCIHQAARVSTTAGDFFVKWNAKGPTDIFLREADGLEALRAAADRDVAVPRVIAAAAIGDEPGFLVLELLEVSGGGGAPHDEKLGRGLAVIHRHAASAFGFSSVTYCGPTAQDNRAASSWADFYRDRRLLPLVDRLGFRGAERAMYDRLAAQLQDFVAPDAPPALIHGDLWSGNVLATPHGPALVDPACAYADREMEFGITTLFGGLTARAFSAYEEAWPLPAGWRERNGLYQVYHLLNHALLFGGGYAGQAREVARRYAG
jgi:protein-ribulosamine 3-kinase